MTRPIPQPVTNKKTAASGEDVPTLKREQQETDGHDGGPGDGEDPVPAGTRHDLTANDGGQQESGHKGEELQSGNRWRFVLDDLEIERQESDGAEHR